MFVVLPMVMCLWTGVRTSLYLQHAAISRTHSSCLRRITPSGLQISLSHGVLPQVWTPADLWSLKVNGWGNKPLEALTAHTSCCF